MESNNIEDENKPDKAKMGRPSKYSQEVADKICHLLSTTSQGLTTICQSTDMPSTVTVYAWLKDPEHADFLNKYTYAREAQADFLADEIIEIADDGSNDFMTVKKGDMEYTVENKEVTNRSKLRVDARKWKASKLAPKKYGDKVDLALRIGKLGKDLADETYE